MVTTLPTSCNPHHQHFVSANITIKLNRRRFCGNPNATATSNKPLKSLNIPHATIIPNISQNKWYCYKLGGFGAIASVVGIMLARQQFEARTNQNRLSTKPLESTQLQSQVTYE